VSIEYTVAVLLVGLGMYCLATKRNLIKLIIGLSIITDGIHLLLISIGYRSGGVPPIVTPEFAENLQAFAQQAVDPVPQALVLTSIVISVCVLSLALSLSIFAYRHYGTLDVRKLRRLRE
jgi:multicomponent Na+:H+ antiporter subunit C